MSDTPWLSLRNISKAGVNVPVLKIQRLIPLAVVEPLNEALEPFADPIRSAFVFGSMANR